MATRAYSSLNGSKRHGNDTFATRAGSVFGRLDDPNLRQDAGQTVGGGVQRQRATTEATVPRKARAQRLDTQPCIQCRRHQALTCTAAYAEVLRPSVYARDCSHGPFCPECRRRVSRQVLQNCICRALVMGWKTSPWQASFGPQMPSQHDKPHEELLNDLQAALEAPTEVDVAVGAAEVSSASSTAVPERPNSQPATTTSGPFFSFGSFGPVGGPPAVPAQESLAATVGPAGPPVAAATPTPAPPSVSSTATAATVLNAATSHPQGVERWTSKSASKPAATRSSRVGFMNPAMQAKLFGRAAPASSTGATGMSTDDGKATVDPDAQVQTAALEAATAQPAVDQVIAPLADAAADDAAEEDGPTFKRRRVNASGGIRRRPVLDDGDNDEQAS